MLATYTQYEIKKKEVTSNPKQPSCCGPQEGYCEKRCEIQGGGEGMA